jgi:hypothetical protein
MKRGRLSVRENPEPRPENWEALGVDPAHVAGWKKLGFDPFEAAMAQGDGFTPAFAVHYRRQLRKTADCWSRLGLDSADGLRWHRAGFGAKEAKRWRSLNVEVEAASGQRAGYRTTDPV